MTTIELENASLETCVEVSGINRDRVLVTRNGRPIAVVVSVEGLDPEHVALTYDTEFWKMIRERRQQPTVTRAELEAMFAEGDLEQSKD